jgi:hypothetical protein
MKRIAATTVLALLVFAQAVSAIPITQTDGFVIRAGKVGMKSDKLEFRSSGGTGVATFKYADSVNNNRTITIPDPGANATLATTAAGSITSANIASGSAKRQVICLRLAPETGAAADSTTYSSLAIFNRAGTVTRIGFSAAVPPVGGTNTLEVLKNNTTTQLSAATFDATTLTAFTTSNATLTGTGADLAMTATDTIHCKYNQGTATTAAEKVAVVIEFEPTDF